MLNRKTAAVLGAGLFILGASALGQTTSSTTTTYTASSSLPPVGLAPTETAQVNIVNIAPLAATIATLGAVPTAPSCTGSIVFLNAKGAAIGTAAPFTLGSGQTFSATLPYTSAGGSGLRTVIRAQINNTIPLSSVAGTAITGIGTILAGTTTGSATFTLAGCALQSSLETYDTVTGVTHVFVSGPTGVQVPTVAIRNGDFSTILPH